MRDYNRSDLKQMFKEQLKEQARDKDGTPITRTMPNGDVMYITRGDVVIDKCISRAERGDMYAVKLIVDLLQPKELRVNVNTAITVDHELSPQLQSIVDRLRIIDVKPEETENDIDIKIIKDEGGSKNGVAIPKTNHIQ